jgi:hypothetical protein
MMNTAINMARLSSSIFMISAFHRGGRSYEATGCLDLIDTLFEEIPADLWQSSCEWARRRGRIRISRLII